MHVVTFDYFFMICRNKPIYDTLTRCGAGSKDGEILAGNGQTINHELTGLDNYKSYY